MVWPCMTYQPLSWFGFGEFHGYPKAYPHKTDRCGGTALCLFFVLGWKVGRCKLLCIKIPFWTNQGQERIQKRTGALVGSKYQESANLPNLLKGIFQDQHRKWFHVKAPLCTSLTEMADKTMTHDASLKHAYLLLLINWFWLIVDCLISDYNILSILYISSYVSSYTWFPPFMHTSTRILACQGGAQGYS